jgi:hypothetical protein
MLLFLPVPIEVALFVAGVVLLLAYALLAGNGSPAPTPKGRRIDQPWGFAYAGGLPMVVTAKRENSQLREMLAYRPTPWRPTTASAPVREYAATTDIQANKRPSSARRSLALMSR